MMRRFVTCLLAFLPAAPLSAAQAQDTLIAIGGLAPRTLRTEYFSLDSDQPMQITAVGGGPQGRSAVRRFLDHGFFQSKEDRTWDAAVWPGNAWILNTITREVVWELRTARTQTNQDGLPQFDGLIRLPAGTYQVSYAALFPVSNYWKDESDWRVKSASNEPQSTRQLHGPYLDDGSYRRFQVIVRGTGHRLEEAAALAEGNRSSLLVLQGNKPRSRERRGFELDRPMEVEVQVVGERERSWTDYGWIMDAATRSIVWTSKTGPGQAAGGSQKNRTIRETVELAAGRYVAVFTTDDSHQPGGWNETPPYDPSSWGLTVRLASEADRSGARSFEYEPIPTTAAFVTLTRLGNDELRWQRFSVTRPIDVQIFALGEGTGRPLNDFAWIVDASGRAVWRMQYDETQPAGGANKNRVFAGSVRLSPGTFTAYYVTDGSHSFGGGWNTDEPMDGEYWGLTIAPSNPKRDAGAVKRLQDAEPSDASVLARVTKVSGSRTGQASFTLAARAAVRVYAVGEGSSQDMFDYATIEEATGREVWRMSFGETEPAGGASKNRRFDRTITLEPATYTVYFLTDTGHGWGEWNAAPPDDPLAYGVTVYRAQASKP